MDKSFGGLGATPSGKFFGPVLYIETNFGDQGFIVSVVAMFLRERKIVATLCTFP